MVHQDGKLYAQRLVFNVWVVGLVLAALSKAIEWAALDSVPFSYDPWALSGPFLAQCILERNRKRIFGVVLAVVVGSCGIAFAFPDERSFAVPYAMAVVSIPILLSAIAFGPAQNRAQAGFVLMVGSLLVVWQQVSDAFQELTKVEYLTFDHRAYLVDLSLGFNPLGFVVSIGKLPMPDLLRTVYSFVLGMTYISIMMMMALVVLLQIQKKSPRWLVALTSMIGAGAVGGILYHVFPAVGPAVAFRSAAHLPTAAQLTPQLNLFDPSHVRNCMPSLHMAWALLVVINAAGLSRLFRISAALFAALTVLATMANGEHYLIDLVVALPYAVAIQILVRSAIYRVWPGSGFWIGAGMVGFWLFALVAHVNWFLAIPGFTAIAMLVTIAVSAIICVMDERKTRDGILFVSPEPVFK